MLIEKWKKHQWTGFSSQLTCHGFRSDRYALCFFAPDNYYLSYQKLSTSGVVYFHDPTFLPGKLQRDSEDSYLHYSSNSAQHAQKQIKPGAVLLSQRCLSQATKATIKSFFG